MSVPAEKEERGRTGRGPKVRFCKFNSPIVVVEFPDDADGIEVLERCFKKHGMTISPDSAARADAVLDRRKQKEKPWYLQEQQKARKRKS